MSESNKNSIKVGLIDPPGFLNGLNVGLAQLASFIRQKRPKVQVKVWDMSSTNVSKRMLEDIKQFNPGLIGVSVNSLTAKTASNLLDCLERNLSCLKVVGGPHIAINGVNFLRQKEVDIAVPGEGELTIIDIIDYLADEKRLDEIQGAIFTREGEIRLTAGSKIKDLNALPPPSFDDFTSLEESSGKIANYPLVTSRGCPYNCSYCVASKISGRRWRGKSPEKILAELQQAREKYGIERFRIVDDNFGLDRKRAMNFCDLLIASDLDLTWSCPNGLRADSLDRDLLQKMRKSGCRSIAIGIESVDMKVLSATGKNITLSEVKDAIRAAQEVGLRVEGFFMIGLPHSTLEKDLKSLKFAEEMDITGLWSLYVPYPKTKGYHYVKQKGSLLRDWRGNTHVSSRPVFETDEYTAEERTAVYYLSLIYNQDKRRERMIKRTIYLLKRVTENPHVLTNNFFYKGVLNWLKKRDWDQLS